MSTLYYSIKSRIFLCLTAIYKINVKEKGKVNDNTAKMQSTNQLGV